MLALLAVGLSYTESGAPAAIWIAVLAAEALVRVVPDGTARRALRLIRVGTLVALVIIAVPFLIRQVRQALYPALEYPSFGMNAAVDNLAATAPPAQEADEERLRQLGYAAKSAAPAPGRPGLFASDAVRSYEYAAVDPKSVVQTGPGLPGWSWNAVTLEWSGPVDRDQRLRLFLLSPSINLLLAVVRTLLLAFLLARLVCPRGIPWRATAPTAALLLAIVAAAPARADFPTDEMLDALRARLLAPPECHPWCAAVPRMRLEVDAGTLRARLQVDVGAATAVPLPGQAQHWLPRTVVVDGKPADALMQGADGSLWLRLDAGTHDVLVEGPLPARDTVQIPLPLLPRLRRDAGRRLDARRRARRRRRRRQPAAHPHRADRRRARRAAASGSTARLRARRAHPAPGAHVAGRDARRAPDPARSRRWCCRCRCSPASR